MAELRPSADEIRERLARVARLATEHGIDAVIVLDPANVYYLSGFRTTLHTRFTAVALRTSAPEEAMLIVPSVDQRLAQRPVWYPSLLERTEVYALGAAPGSAARSLESLLDQPLRDGDVLGVDLAGASYGQVLQLTKRYPESRLVDASEVLHAVRRVKSDFELEALRRANTVAIEALARVPSLLHTGMSEIDLGLALDAAARRAGSDGEGYPTLVGFGPKSLAPHAPPTEQRLQPNSIVTIAFGPTVAGYTADVVRTFFYGEPPPLAVESASRTVAMQAASLDAVRAGVPISVLVEAAGRELSRVEPGAPSPEGIGHSVGLTIHETPRISISEHRALEPDMVLAIEPRAPSTAMEEIGLYRHCDVVRVTTDGYELLTPFDRGLLVVPA